MKTKNQFKKREKNSLDINVHWYRRVFHAFGASFIIYYMLSNEIKWIYYLKIIIPLAVLIFAFILEWLRLNKKINNRYFFGLRVYEEKRIASYLFFSLGMVILFFFFPQQIAIPCIMCACIADPIMGEMRNRFNGSEVYFIGFFVCMLFFMVTWYKANIWMMFIVSIIGAIGAVVGETKKFRWLDDDFMVQIIPAILLLIIWNCALFYGWSLPDPIIYPW